MHPPLREGAWDLLRSQSLAPLRGFAEAGTSLRGLTPPAID